MRPDNIVKLLDSLTDADRGDRYAIVMGVVTDSVPHLDYPEDATVKSVAEAGLDMASRLNIPEGDVHMKALMHACLLATRGGKLRRSGDEFIDKAKDLGIWGGGGNRIDRLREDRIRRGEHL